jgi:virginiamycin B lyase
MWTVVILLAVSPLQFLAPVPARAAVTTLSGGTDFVLSNGYRIVLHPVPTGDSGPWSISVDRGGTVWFLEETTNQLASYTPGTGAFQEYPIPTSQSSPQAVTTDASGNVWFTELTSSMLAELPHGSSKIVEYPIPSLQLNIGSTTEPLDCGPGAIASDPSGFIWIACLFSNQIDEYSPGTGAFVTFDLPVFPTGPAGLVFDGRGDLWFTAADANMLGKAIISQLVSGTSDGITEFAPLNQTYVFEYSEQTSFTGGATTLKSSLPTPSGIALAPDGRLWVTEHVDSSFDSYDPASGSLDRYWTSQTYGAFGFDVSFPNGIAAAKDGTVWVAEHYGNKVAEFDPASGQLTEYSASCCSSAYAGIYTLALAPDGTPWFVEVQGNAIGELVPTDNASSISVNLPAAATIPGSGGSITLPLRFSESSGPADLSLELSGISGTGAPANMTAAFSPSSVSLDAGDHASSNLTLATDGLKPGVYYLTLTANNASQDVLYSVILKLTVTGSSVSQTLLIAAGAAVLAVMTGAYLARRRSTARRHRQRL